MTAIMRRSPLYYPSRSIGVPRTATYDPLSDKVLRQRLVQLATSIANDALVPGKIISKLVRMLFTAHVRAQEIGNNVATATEEEEMYLGKAYDDADSNISYEEAERRREAKRLRFDTLGACTSDSETETPSIPQTHINPAAAPVPSPPTSPPVSQAPENPVKRDAAQDKLDAMLRGEATTEDVRSLLSAITAPEAAQELFPQYTAVQMANRNGRSRRSPLAAPHGKRTRCYERHKNSKLAGKKRKPSESTAAVEPASEERKQKPQRDTMFKHCGTLRFEDSSVCVHVVRETRRLRGVTLRKLLLKQQKRLPLKAFVHITPIVSYVFGREYRGRQCMELFNACISEPEHKPIGELTVITGEHLRRSGLPPSTSGTAVGLTDILSMLRAVYATAKTSSTRNEALLRRTLSMYASLSEMEKRIRTRRNKSKRKSTVKTTR